MTVKRNNKSKSQAESNSIQLKDDSKQDIPPKKQQDSTSITGADKKKEEGIVSPNSGIQTNNPVVDMKQSKEAGQGQMKVVIKESVSLNNQNDAVVITAKDHTNASKPNVISNNNGNQGSLATKMLNPDATTKSSEKQTVASTKAVVVGSGATSTVAASQQVAHSSTSKTSNITLNDQNEAAATSTAAAAATSTSTSTATDKASPTETNASKTASALGTNTDQVSSTVDVTTPSSKSAPLTSSTITANDGRNPSDLEPTTASSTKPLPQKTASSNEETTTTVPKSATMTNAPTTTTTTTTTPTKATESEDIHQAMEYVIPNLHNLPHNILALLQTYGPLTQSEIEFNLPPSNFTKEIPKILEIMILLNVIHCSQGYYYFHKGDVRGDVVLPHELVSMIQDTQAEIRASDERIVMLKDELKRNVPIKNRGRSIREFMKNLALKYDGDDGIRVDVVYATALRSLNVEVGLKRKAAAAAAAAAAEKESATKKFKTTDGSNDQNKTQSASDGHAAVGSNAKEATTVVESSANQPSSKNNTDAPSIELKNNVKDKKPDDKESKDNVKDIKKVSVPDASSTNHDSKPSGTTSTSTSNPSTKKASLEPKPNGTDVSKKSSLQPPTKEKPNIVQEPTKK